MGLSMQTLWQAVMLGWLTWFATAFYLAKDQMTLEQTLHREGHAVTPMNVQLAMAISSSAQERARKKSWQGLARLFCWIE